MLEEVASSITAYTKCIPVPRLQITKRKMATEGIAAMVKRCDEVLWQLDVLVRMLETRRPDFYEKYFGNRNIIDTGSRVLSIRGFVRDVSGVGIEKVSIYVKGSKKRVKKTSAMGNFLMKNLGDGEFELTFKRSGYKDLVIVVAVVKGKRSEVRVVMEKIDCWI